VRRLAHLAALVAFLLASASSRALADEGAFPLERLYRPGQEDAPSAEGIEVPGQGRILFERQYQDVRNSTLDIVRRFPPDRYYYVGVGRSPMANVTLLQTLNPKIAMHFPASGLHGAEVIKEEHVEEYMRHFASLLPDEKTLGNRTLLLMDHSYTGSSIVRVREMTERYLTSIGSDRKVEAVVFSRQHANVEHVDVHMIPADPYPFMLLPQDLGRYAEHSIGEHKLKDLKVNPAHDQVRNGIRRWVKHDAVLDDFLAQPRSRSQAGSVPRVAQSVKRAGDPELVEMTNRCLSAISTLLDRGAISGESLRAFSEKHGLDVRRGDRSFLVSDLIPEREATTSERWAARQLLQLYDGQKLETDVVRRWVTERRHAHEAQRAQVKDASAPSMPMEFIRVNPGKMVWEGRSIEIPHRFELQTTPLLRQQWEALGRPVRDPPTKMFGEAPWFDAPVVFTINETPALIEAINKLDPLHDYRLMTEDEWLFVASNRGALNPSQWDTKLILEHAWLEDNKGDAPYLPAPVRGRKPILIDGKPIWGLFGNARQLVTTCCQVLQQPRTHLPIQRHLADGKLVGGYIHLSAGALRDPANWVVPNPSAHGAIRLTRWPKGKVPPPPTPPTPTPPVR
jgi:hypothetical protein